MDAHATCLGYGGLAMELPLQATAQARSAGKSLRHWAYLAKRLGCGTDWRRMFGSFRSTLRLRLVGLPFVATVVVCQEVD
jgi:hypothetical protein